MFKGHYNIDNKISLIFLLLFFFCNFFVFVLFKDSIKNSKGTTTHLYKLIAVTKTTPQQLLMKKVCNIM